MDTEHIYYKGRDSVVHRNYLYYDLTGSEIDGPRHHPPHHLPVDQSSKVLGFALMTLNTRFQFVTHKIHKSKKVRSYRNNKFSFLYLKY